MPLKSQKIRDSAKGEQCTLRLPNICNHDPATTVLAHAPDIHRGKAQKTDDYWAAYACSNCHAIMDMKRIENPASYWLPAIKETQSRLIEKGLISIPETKTKPKTVQKVVPRSGLYVPVKTEPGNHENLEISVNEVQDMERKAAFNEALHTGDWSGLSK